MAKKSTGQSSSPRVARLLRESICLILTGAALYLILIFFSYHRGDAGWSHSGDFNQINNAGGHVGAWLADLLLFLFGASAWWWVAFFLSAVAWSYRRIDAAGIFDRHSLVLSASGFMLLLAASSGLESLRFHTLNVSLPLMPGGMLGNTISYYLSRILGFTGATLTLLILIAIGFSQFTGLSWVRFVEKIGENIETFCLFIQDSWQTRQDKFAGQIGRAHV